MPELVAIGDICRKFNAEHHRVVFAIKSRGIEPVMRVGRYRLFDAAAVKAIGKALVETAKANEGTREVARAQ